MYFCTLSLPSLGYESRQAKLLYMEIIIIGLTLHYIEPIIYSYHIHTGDVKLHV